MRTFGDSARNTVRLRGGVVCVLFAWLCLAVAPPGIADEFHEAKKHLSAIEQRLHDRKQKLAELDRELHVIANRIAGAQERLEQTQSDIERVRAELAKTRAHYEEVRAEINRRIRQAYMQGPGDGLEFFLSARSFDEAVDRIGMIEHMTTVDAQLAHELEAVAAQLADQQAELSDLKAKRVEILHQLAEDQRKLREKFAKQRKLIAYLQEQRAAVEEQITRLQPFLVCPVDGPHTYTDDFGAPRFTTKPPHPHGGNDILAPMGTPIVAPFDGVARGGHNTLGGLSVNVYGANGYVYNAHLARLGNTGQVRTGDVIGYVGNSGDAKGGPPHDHFEWHPKTFPSNLHKSPQGFTRVDGAIDPFPFLERVC